MSGFFSNTARNVRYSSVICRNVSGFVSCSCNMATISGNPPFVSYTAFREGKSCS